MRKQKGFLLIELLIVVVIILILAAIAIPNLLRSRIAANVALGEGPLRVIDAEVKRTSVPEEPKSAGYSLLACLPHVRVSSPRHPLKPARSPE